MALRTLRSLVALSVACVSVFAQAEPVAGQSESLRSLLEFLDGQAAGSYCVRQVAEDVRLVLPDGRGSPATPMGNAWRSQLANVGAEPALVQYQSYSGGRIAGISMPSGRMAPLLTPMAFYWSGSCGVSMDLSQRVAKPLSRLASLRAPMWPMRTLGFVVPHPLAGRIRLAQSRGHLEAGRRGDTLVLTMPFTRPEDATRLHCEYDLADGIRLVRLECQVDSRPQWGLSVHEWTDEGHPAAYSFSVHQEDESVRYSFRAERVDDTFISGASVLANLNAFILAGSDTASSEAVDSLVREVAGDYFGWPRAPGAPAPLSIEQFKSAESIASDPWPSLTLEDITARAHGESPLNVTSAYCGHMVLAALSHWGSHEPTAFSSLRQGFPEPTLDCTEISEAIREFGGDYEVVTGLTNEHLRTIEQPFLVVTKGGEGDESVRHIQIWQYDSEDTYFRLWSPPRQFGRGQHVNRSEGDSSRVFFVPRGVVAASRKGGTGFVIPALAALLGGVLILAVARLFRSRNVRGAFVAVLLLASLFGASCGSERVETPLAEIEAARGAPLSVVVESRQVVTRSFWVQNVADRDIRVVVQPPGCSCIRVSSEPIEVDRGGRAEVRLELIGGESGMRREVLRVVASDGERSTMEELEVEVLSGPPVYTRPSTVTVAAQPDEMVEQCFDLIIVTCREELEAGSISVVSSPESFVITPAMMREPVKTRTANGKFAHVLACSLFVPPVEPGVYLVNVEVVVDALPELEVERDRREFRIERQITVTVS